MTLSINGISIPDSQLARDVTQLVRDTESPLLFHHSSRVYYFGALAGKHRGLRFDPELLYTGAMFHDMGLTHAHSSAHERFEVDGADAAREFLRSRGISRVDIDTVWTAIALHTTPEHPQAHASRRRTGDRGRRDGRVGPPPTPNMATTNARPWCELIRGTSISRKISCRLSTTVSSISRTRHSAMSRPTFSLTRTRPSCAAISAA